MDEQLDRQHRQERQEDARDQYAEHVAEIGARRHLDVLDDVGKCLAPLDDRLLQHHQALLQQDDVGRLLGDIDGRIDRNTHVRVFQRRRIVDAVAHIADGVAVALQRADHP